MGATERTIGVCNGAGFPGVTAVIRAIVRSPNHTSAIGSAENMSGDRP